ncbi:hypothetical protein OJJOAM_000063 [Cupriavidus sp. H18C1]
MSRPPSPDLELVWLTVSAGEEQVFLLTYEALQAAGL